MKKYVLLVLLMTILSINLMFGQGIEKIEVPKGVVYNYCDLTTFVNAKGLIKQSLSSNDDYSLVNKVMFIGPVLWEEFQKNDLLSGIAGGNITLLVDNRKLSAKLTQRLDDGKKVWSEFRKVVAENEYILRKASPEELEYYWSIISFDIEEPLIILETRKTRYIINIIPKTMKLMWLDEFPQSIKAPIMKDGDCKKNFVGTWRYAELPVEKAYVVRTLDKQVEYYDSGKYHFDFDIKWINPCQYQAIYKGTNSPMPAHSNIGEITNIEILEIDQGKMRYRAKFRDQEEVGGMVRSD